MTAVTAVTRRRVRWERKLQDAWIGAYWQRDHWWGGTIAALDDDGVPHLAFNLWICLVPFLPIHYESMTCPEPRSCRSGRCWVRDVGRAHLSVVMGEDIECPRCHDTGRIHNVAMGPPHLNECTWCYIACPLCQGRDNRG